MKRLPSSLRATGAFSLIVLLQTHLAAAHPFPAPQASSSNNGTRSDGRQHFAPKNVVPPYPVGDQASSCSSDIAWPTTYTISEIVDGQIQAPYQKFTDRPSRSDWSWGSDTSTPWPTPAITTSESQTVVSSQSSAESSTTSPLVFGSITLSWSTSFDTTSGTPAVAESFPPTTVTQTQTQTTTSSADQSSSNQQTGAQQTSNADTTATSPVVPQSWSDQQSSNVQQALSDQQSSTAPSSSSSESATPTSASESSASSSSSAFETSSLSLIHI